MEPTAFELILVDSQFRRMTLNVGQRNPRGLLHDIAQLTGEHEAALAGSRHGSRFDEQHVTAGTRSPQDL